MKNLFNQNRLLAIGGILLLIAAVSVCDVVAGEVSPTYVKHSCLEIKANDPSYMEAVKRVTSTPMVKDWVSSLGQQERMVLGQHIDKTEFIKGHCYWSISIYESNEHQFRLWKVFRASMNSNDIYVMGDEGSYLSFTSSRPQSK
jgi:hypothetical protein